MLSVALASLVLSTTALTPAAGAVPAHRALSDPPIRVSLNHSTYEPGDRARVTVRVRDDGYLLVLHLDPSGMVRVLFPLDPGDDNFVRGGQSYEIRGRGDREAFLVDGGGRNGSGTVYAAWSADPYRFDDYVRGDHWDYRVVGDSALPNDPETGLTNIAQRMSTGHFDYDLVSYNVQNQVAYSSYAPAYYPPPPPVYYGGYSCWYDPWCDGFYPYPYRSSFFFSFGFGAPFYPYYYRPFYYPFYRPAFFGGPIVVVNRPIFVSPFRPYQWKGGIVGGGGSVGVQYRPRTALAMNTGNRMSPLFAASPYRQVSAERPMIVPRRGTGVAGVSGSASPRFGGGTPVRSEAGVARGSGVRSGDWRSGGRRMVTVDGVDRPAIQRSNGPTSRVMPGRVQVNDGTQRGFTVSPRNRGDLPEVIRGSQQGMMRPVDPQRSYGPPTRVTPQYSPAPTRVTPQYAPPRQAQPMRSGGMRASPPVQRSGGGGGGWHGGGVRGGGGGGAPRGGGGGVRHR